MAVVTQKEQVDQFLATYKELEKLVEMNHGQTIFEFEQGLETVAGKKLQLCRNIRNYVQHNDDCYVFVSVPDAMIQFLKDLCTGEMAKMANVDEMLVKPFPKKQSTDGVVSGVKMLQSKGLQSIPILDEDKKLIGVLTQESVMKIVCSVNVTSDLMFVDVLKYIKPDFKTILFVKAKDKADDVMDAVKESGCLMVLVTGDGTKNGKVLGQMQLS